jgi:hypothetical protein
MAKAFAVDVVGGGGVRYSRGAHRHPASPRARHLASGVVAAVAARRGGPGLAAARTLRRRQEVRAGLSAASRQSVLGGACFGRLAACLLCRCGWVGWGDASPGQTRTRGRSELLALKRDAKQLAACAHAPTGRLFKVPVAQVAARGAGNMRRKAVHARSRRPSCWGAGQLASRQQKHSGRRGRVAGA